MFTYNRITPNRITPSHIMPNHITRPPQHRSRGRAGVAKLFAVTLLAAPLLLASPAAVALEDWQLSHGPFVTGADVRPHAGLPQDRGDILAAITQETPDWRRALEIYAFGRHFPWRDQTHSLGRFADDYNGAMPAVVPASVEHFGEATFQNAWLFSALAGTRTFQGADDALRVAAVDGGTLATILNWCRFELVMSERKAKADDPNWSTRNGSPKNWNEIFAFYRGTNGTHSVYEALASSEEGAALNAALMEVLAVGQEDVLAETWPEEAGREVEALLDRAALLILHDALADLDGLSDEALAATQVRAAGLWLAASQSIAARDTADADAIRDALSGAPDAVTLAFAADTVEAHLAQ
ncbi:MAG: hypothetical protein ACXIVD_16775 [Salinarimonas sp.]